MGRRRGDLDEFLVNLSANNFLDIHRYGVEMRQLLDGVELFNEFSVWEGEGDEAMDKKE